MDHDFKTLQQINPDLAAKCRQAIGAVTEDAIRADCDQKARDDYERAIDALNHE